MAKILVVANFLIPPIRLGSQKCIDSYCNTLRNLGHEVYYLYSGYGNHNDDADASNFWHGNYFHYQYSLILRALNLVKRKLLYAINGGCYTIGFYYPVFGLDKYVEKLQKHYHFDAIIVNYPWMSPLLQKTSIPLKLLFTHDKFTDKRLLIKAEYYSLSAKQEAEALNRADVVLSIQNEETQYFKELLPHKQILTVYTRFDYMDTISNNNKTVLFFSGDSDLNRNGITCFVEKVWPIVTSSVPEAKLIVGGGICKSLKEEIKDANIELVGYVDDVDDFYRKGNIAINPVYQGTGLKIKTLEALSYGKITVVHPHSIAGLYKKDQAPVYVGDTCDKYANYIISALNGDIDPKDVANKCKLYIDEMDNFIIQQYKKIKYQ